MATQHRPPPPLPLPPQPTKQLELDITIVSAKHLKNVNWRNGNLKPYAVFWIDPDRRLFTKPDESGSTSPVWNERFTLPINKPLDDPSCLLTLEIFHSKPSDTPKPLVGTLHFPLKNLVPSETEDPSSSEIRKFELVLPSGRPQGKIKVKMSIRERPLPDYHIAHQHPYYYSSAPSPPLPDYRQYSSTPSPYVSAPVSAPVSPYPYTGYSDTYSGYYSGYYGPPPPLPPRPFFDRPVAGYGGPSAPVDYSGYEKQKGGKLGVGSGLAVGAVGGALGGLTLEERMKYEEEKTENRVESDLPTRDDYSDYRGNY
ncbi:C2 domain [Dillenia turbinata]|uniref:C2 domain n=1 Tax=Dillenia turbinata TaxID=194707 RepID=A0AAN8V9S7_9MAGN